MNHFLKFLIAGFFAVTVISMGAEAQPTGESGATSDAESKALEIAPAILMSRILDQVSISFTRYGTDHLQTTLRFYADQGVRLEVLRREVLSSNHGAPKTFVVDAEPFEILAANQVLTESGFDFICFESAKIMGVRQSSQSVVQTGHARWIEPIIVFASALTAGMIQVAVQQAQAEELGKPVGDFVAQLRPYIGMGVMGAIMSWQFEQFRPWWQYHFWSPRTTPFDPAFTFGSAKDLMQRILRPRGRYAEIIRDILTPIALVFTASSVAAYPGNPVIYDAPSPQSLVSVTLLYVFSFGATKMALDIFQRRGALSEKGNSLMESVARRMSRIALIAGLVPSTGLAGQITQALISVFSSGRLWLKLKWADPLYRMRTANIFDARSFPMTGTQKFCARATEALTSGFKFQKQVGPSLSSSSAGSSF